MANFEGGTSVQYAEKVAGDLNSAGDRGAFSRGVAEAAGIFDQHNGAWATAQQELSANVNLKQFGLDGFQLVGAADSNPADPSLELSNGRQDLTLDAQGRISDAQTGAPGYFQQESIGGPEMPWMPAIPNYYPGQFDGSQPGYGQQALEFPPLMQMLQQGLNPEMPPPAYDQNGQPYPPVDSYYQMPGGYLQQQQLMGPYDSGTQGVDPFNPLSLLNQMTPLQNFNAPPDYPQNYDGSSSYTEAPPPIDGDSGSNDDMDDY